MHRTIVQNKILRIICSCPFFCPGNIYRSSLGKVRLGRPNPKPPQPLNFYLRRKRKNICITTYQSLISILILIYFQINIKKWE